MVPIIPANAEKRMPSPPEIKRGPSKPETDPPERKEIPTLAFDDEAEIQQVEENSPERLVTPTLALDILEQQPDSDNDLQISDGLEVVQSDSDSSWSEFRDPAAQKKIPGKTIYENDDDIDDIDDIDITQFIVNDSRVSLSSLGSFEELLAEPKSLKSEK